MVLGDFLRDLFSKKKASDPADEIGVTGLPRNIEDDLIKQGKNRHNHDTWQNSEWQDAFPNFSICIGPECESHYDDEFFQVEQNMMKQLEDMMQGLFRGFGGHDFMQNFPKIEGPESELKEDNGRKEEQSLRDKMLKDHKREPFGNIEDFQVAPFHHGHVDDDECGSHSMMDWSWTFPFGGFGQRERFNDLKDRDFDCEVESGKAKLDDIMKNESDEKQKDTGRLKHDGFSCKTFSSITTKRSADGIVESQKTVRDSEGNEEITVIRRIGDQEHKKTIKKDQSGNEETNENLVNMDDGDLEKFEDAWTRTRKGQLQQFPENNSDSNIDSFLSGRHQDSLWDLFFPWKRN